MPPKYILGYYYIHNPLLVNSLCQEESGWPPPHPHPHPTPPHPTTEEVSDMNQECQPKGKTEKEKKNWFTFQKFPEPTSAGNNP